jgi:hypothetical protein
VNYTEAAKRLAAALKTKLAPEEFALLFDMLSDDESDVTLYRALDGAGGSDSANVVAAYAAYLHDEAHHGGVERIQAERERQVAEGYTPEHDDEHDGGEMALAAACYAASAARERIYVRENFADQVSFTDPFPWSKGGRGSTCEDERPYNGNVLKDPTDEEAIRLLEVAGALCAAEIDRLQRKKAKKPGVSELPEHDHGADEFCTICYTAHRPVRQDGHT